jgi:hypothetical protein
MTSGQLLSLAMLSVVTVLGGAWFAWDGLNKWRSGRSDFSLVARPVIGGVSLLISGLIVAAVLLSVVIREVSR